MGSFERAFWYILAEATPKSEVRNLGERVQPKRTPYTHVMFPERRLIKSEKISRARNAVRSSDAKCVNTWRGRSSRFQNGRSYKLYFDLASSETSLLSATQSISTVAPKGSSLTATATLAGGFSPNFLA